MNKVSVAQSIFALIQLMLNIIVPLEWLCKELLPLLATCNYMQVVGCARMSSYFYPPYIMM